MPIKKVTPDSLTLSDLQERIKRVYASLSPSECKLVDVLLTKQYELASYSATELAKLAGISKSTAARCFKHLGFRDFNQLRMQLRAHVTHHLSPLTHLENKQPPAEADALNSFYQHIEVEKLKLDETLNSLLPESLAQALTLLLGAKRVWVVGFRNSYATAFYAQSVFSHVLNDVCLLNEGSVKIADNLADLSQYDLFFIVDFPRRLNLLNQLVEVATFYKVPMIILSDAPISSVSAQAKVVLPCCIKNNYVFDSYTAGLSLVNYLANELVKRIPAQAQKRMQHIEQIHNLLEDLEK